MSAAGTTTIWITGDQVSPRNSALLGVDRSRASVLMIESLARSRRLPYHKRKLVLIFAAMRAYADDLRRDGWRVDYHAERDDFETPLAEHIARNRPARVRMMAQSEHGVAEAMTASRCGVRPGRRGNAACELRLDEPTILTALSRGERARVTMETFYRAHA